MVVIRWSLDGGTVERVAVAARTGQPGRELDPRTATGETNDCTTACCIGLSRISVQIGQYRFSARGVRVVWYWGNGSSLGRCESSAQLFAHSCTTLPVSPGGLLFLTTLRFCPPPWMMVSKCKQIYRRCYMWFWFCKEWFWFSYCAISCMFCPGERDDSVHVRYSIFPGSFVLVECGIAGVAKLQREDMLIISSHIHPKGREQVWWVIAAMKNRSPAFSLAQSPSTHSAMLWQLLIVELHDMGLVSVIFMYIIWILLLFSCHFFSSRKGLAFWELLVALDQSFIHCLTLISG